MSRQQTVLAALVKAYIICFSLGILGTEGQFQRGRKVADVLINGMGDEPSNLAASQRNADVLWIPDASTASLHAISTAGIHVRTFELLDSAGLPIEAANGFQDMTVGTGPGGRSYVYLANGGFAESQSDHKIQIYRVPEPVVSVREDPSTIYNFTQPLPGVDTLTLALPSHVSVNFYHHIKTLLVDSISGEIVFSLQDTSDPQQSAIIYSTGPGVASDATASTEIALASKGQLGTPEVVAGTLSSNGGELLIKSVFGVYYYPRFENNQMLVSDALTDGPGFERLQFQPTATQGLAFAHDRTGFYTLSPSLTLYFYPRAGTDSAPGTTSFSVNLPPASLPPTTSASPPTSNAPTSFPTTAEPTTEPTTEPTAEPTTEPTTREPTQNPTRTELGDWPTADDEEMEWGFVFGDTDTNANSTTNSTNSTNNEDMTYNVTNTTTTDDDDMEDKDENNDDDEVETMGEFGNVTLEPVNDTDSIDDELEELEEEREDDDDDEGVVVVSNCTKEINELIPGLLTCMQHGLLLSQGLRARILANSTHKVNYTDGSQSSEPFHGRPDFGATFEDTRGWNPGGWVYVSNSEIGPPDTEIIGQGGVGALTFDPNGDVIGYQMLLTGTTMNCGGGRTPWNTWISCEETQGGMIYQVDPMNQRLPSFVAVDPKGGFWESFAYDVRDPGNPHFFVTNDSPRGALVRITPEERFVNWDSTEEAWNMLHGLNTIEYLILDPSSSSTSSGTFNWTTDRKLARDNAEDNYQNSEGIDAYEGKLYFVTKEKKYMFELDLDAMTYTRESTRSGLFDGSPDQVHRILADADEDFLFFTEEGGKDAGIHGRDSNGVFFTLLESPEYPDETTGLAFSPNMKHIYVAYQKAGLLFDISRQDGLPFTAKSLNLKYHTS